MAEAQATHRRSLESSVVAEKIAAQRRGQVLGFIVILLVIGIGGMLLYTGRDISGLVTLVTALVSLVSVFVYGRRKEAEERQRKRNDFGRQ